MNVRYQENYKISPRGPQGLGGWLILVGIGVIIGPIATILSTIIEGRELWDDGYLVELLTPGSEYYHSSLGIFFIGQILFQLAFIAAGIYLAYLFFSKNRKFPGTYIILAIALPVVTLAEATLLNHIRPDIVIFDSWTVAVLRQNISGIIIWVPYMLLSKRVKATFVNSSQLQNYADLFQ